MKTKYQTPQTEIIEIELEGVLCGSGDGDDSGSTNVTITVGLPGGYGGN